MHASSVRVVAFAAVALAAMPFLAVEAQEKPTPKTLASLTGTWRYDAERSDPLANNPMAVAALRARPDDAVGGAPSGGGGRRGGGGAGGMRRGGGAGVLRNPYVRELITQLQPPAMLRIEATDATTSIGVPNMPDVEPISWTTDGKKRQKAQMDGTLLEFTGKWHGEKVTLTDAVSGTAELKRDLHVIENGAVLAMKLELSGTGFPQKLERKVYFQRVE